MVRFEDVRGGNAVRSFGSPLVFFAKAPENEDTGEDNGKHEGKPCPVWDFGERRREVETVERAEDQETK